GLFAALVAAGDAECAASLVPARVDAALLLEGSQAAAGLRAFFDGVEQRAPALSAAAQLAALVGPDLLREPLSWGLAPSGARAGAASRRQGTGTNGLLGSDHPLPARIAGRVRTRSARARRASISRRSVGPRRGGIRRPRAARDSRRGAARRAQRWRRSAVP